MATALRFHNTSSNRIRAWELIGRHGRSMSEGSCTGLGHSVATLRLIVWALKNKGPEVQE